MVDLEVAGQSCGSAMWSLSKKICSGKGARECPQLDGLFNYIKGHSGGDWGVVGGTWHAMGKEYTSGNGKTHYAYCVMQ